MCAKKMEEKFDVNDIYTPLSVAKKEIKKRWKDKKLRKKVEDFLGGDVPDFLKKGPKAALVRDVASASHESMLFLNLAKQINIEPVFVEYSENKFVARNSNSYHLCRMFFYNGIGKKGGHKIDSKKVVNFNKEEGKKMRNMKTLCGTNFLDFHHKVLKKSIPGVKEKDICDFSLWFNKHRKLSKYYYLHYLALFLVHGILFENFITNEEEKDFTLKKIIPSFYKLEKIFGIKPLVVPLAPIEDENEVYWWCYPYSVKKVVDKQLK